MFARCFCCFVVKLYISMNFRKKDQLGKILTSAIFMALGAFFLKILPMRVWGNNILFDASFHIIFFSFCLYVIWFFIDQNKSWRLPFFLFVILILFVVSIQRIIDNAHNDVGLLLGIIISIISIAIAERKNLKNKIVF